MLASGGRATEARDFYYRATETLHSALRREPGNTTARRFLSITYFGRSCAVWELANRVDALADLDRAFEFGDAPRRCWLGGRRAVVRAMLDDAAGAAADAAAATADPAVSTETLLDSARAYALASALNASGSRPGTAARDREQRYQAEAVKLLNRAWQANPGRPSEFLSFLTRTPQLEPLHARADFRALLLDVGFPADPFAR